MKTKRRASDRVRESARRAGQIRWGNTGPVLTEEERFWSKVDKRPDGCWEWLGFKDKDGYGFFSDSRGRNVRAHRHAYEQAHGELDPGIQVLHRCDNPPCVRDDHLFTGSNLDNIADRVKKGRSARGDRAGLRLHPERAAAGERNGRAKLSAAQVAEVRRRRAAGETLRALGRAFGVTHRAIRLVTIGETWK